MFGSKIRSWMENHIVRPRKKGNKSNKNGTSIVGSSVASVSTSNGHKTNGFQTATDISSNTNTIARRSEVSPIQSHTTSRAGWQSPREENAMSPKSDHFLYRHTIRSPPSSSTASPRNMPRKSSYTLDSGSSSYNHHQPYPRQQSHNQHYRQDFVHSNSQPVSLQYSKSEDSQRIFNGEPTTNGNRYSTTASSSSTSNEMLLDSNQPRYERVHFDEPATTANYFLPTYHPSSHNNRDSGVETSNRDSFESSSTSASASYLQYKDEPVEIGRRSASKDETNKSSGRRNHPSKHQYGKILLRNQTPEPNTIDNHTQMTATGQAACQPYAAPTMPHSGNGKQRNVNFEQQVTCDNNRRTAAYTPRPPSSSNNNHVLPIAAGELSRNHQRATIHRPHPPPPMAAAEQHVSFVSGNGPPPKHHHLMGSSIPSDRIGAIGVIKSTAAMHPPSLRGRLECGGGVVRNNNVMRPMIRGANSGSHAMTSMGPPHQLVHMINSLSSPESAYSTGYSTDGTSPGTGSTPEYYINMRTGTHYFPRGVNPIIDPNRSKYGLNKIDESSQQLDSASVTPNHRRLESMSCEMARRHLPYSNGATKLVLTESSLTQNNNGQLIVSKQMVATATSNRMSPDVQRRLTMQAYKTMESPSPRQRCRIRTNPWFSSIDPSVLIGANKMKAIDMDISSTSSGLKSSSDIGKPDVCNKNVISSGSEDSSSDTEIEINQKPNNGTPGTIRKRRIDLVPVKLEAVPSAGVAASGNHGDSDEDATLNEMMGKFDESYCYEQETDILSDSDPTECISDLDTGQDGGDECDTDDLLEIDFIDTGSIQEIVDNHIYENTGNCSYYQNGAMERPRSCRAGSKKVNNTCGEESISSKRRKRLTRTRKSSRECRDSSAGTCASPAKGVRPSRSLGGTPVSLRRNKNKQSNSPSNINPLETRANSMNFSDVHSLRNGVLTVAESEKALIKADLEADVKYKQLIHEAETILVSMKTSNSASTSVRETPVASPRRICPIPTNKRVEMLRQCEADLRREINKAQKLSELIDAENMSSSPAYPIVALTQQMPSENINIVINKRVEVLKFETTTTSTPNSPKASRFSPRKTHVSNFIYQNTSPTDLMRRKSSPDTQPEQTDTRSSKYSPQLHLNGRRLSSPPKSPTPMRRRFRSQSPRLSIDSESDTPSDEDALRAQNKHNNLENDILRRKPKPKRKDGPHAVRDTLDRSASTVTPKKSLLSFRSIDMGNNVPENCYCPQSEPLKRKVYTGSQTLDRLKKSLEQESEIPKQALLDKISQLRRNRQAAAAQTQTELYEPMNHMVSSDAENSPLMRRSASPASPAAEVEAQNLKRQQLILSTLADLKRSLEDQSVELCGLNTDE